MHVIVKFNNGCDEGDFLGRARGDSKGGFILVPAKISKKKKKKKKEVEEEEEVFEKTRIKIAPFDDGEGGGEGERNQPNHQRIRRVLRQSVSSSSQ